MSNRPDKTAPAGSLCGPDKYHNTSTHGGSGLDTSTCSPVHDYPEGIEETWRADAGWKRADEAEAVIEQIRNLVTTDHESKSAFISRVRECLPPKHF